LRPKRPHRSYLEELLVAPVIDRRALAGWQLDPTPGREFEQQRPTGHVVETARPVVPPPLSAEFAREPRPMPRGIFSQKRLDLCQIGGAQSTALDDRFGRHPALRYDPRGGEFSTG
jgi:hypothetical protein